MRFNYWIETRNNERGSAEKPTFLVLTCFMYEIVFWRCLLMGGELSNETNIDVLLRFQLRLHQCSPRSGTTILSRYYKRNSKSTSAVSSTDRQIDRYSTLCWKISVFEFPPMSRREIESTYIYIYIYIKMSYQGILLIYFFCACTVVSGSVAWYFNSKFAGVKLTRYDLGLSIF